MRGQATAEFLMTYGWALLILFVVVGLLISSGAFSADQFISEECSFGSNVPCQAALFDEGGQTHIAIRLYNSFSYPILVRNYSLSTSDGSQAFEAFPNDIEIKSGAYHDYESVLDGPALPEGSLTRFSGYVEYSSCAPEVSDDSGCSPSSHVLWGRVVSRVLRQ